MKPLRVVDSAPPQLVGPIHVGWKELEGIGRNGYYRHEILYSGLGPQGDVPAPLKFFFESVDATIRSRHLLHGGTLLKHCAVVLQDDALLINHSFWQNIKEAFKLSTQSASETFRPGPSHLDGEKHYDEKLVSNDSLVMARFEGTVFNLGKHIATHPRLRFTNIALLAPQTRVARCVEFQVPTGYAAVLNSLNHVHRSPTRQRSVDGKNEIFIRSLTYLAE